MSRSGPEKKPPFLVFIAASVVFFFLALSAADSVGFVPCSLDDTCKEEPQYEPQILTYVPEINEVSTVAQESVVSITPKHIRISAIDLDLIVQNPETIDLLALDVILQKGPARHALSGKLGDDRNMIVFGHSSHLPIVHNQMYKAFNRVPDLKAGDTIEVDGEDGSTHVYSIQSVTKADASNFDENFLGVPEKKLIIVTCDTLAGKSARYIVRAEYVGISE